MIIEPLQAASAQGEQAIEALLSRFQTGDASCAQKVAEIIEAVKHRGDDALLEYTRKFDAADMDGAGFGISAAELKRAYDQVDGGFLETLEIAIDRIRGFHEREMEDSWMQTREDGTIVGRLVRPVDSCGLYVPGGRGGSTPLVSSVLMNGIPATIAGVTQRVMVSPPGTGGALSPHLLVAAQEIGITEIYKVGSAWAIAALAFGTQTIPPVDVIVGPGNQWVTEAKHQVSGRVRIDMIAGPSEVLIVADASADSRHVAADMLAQAEHDPQALAVVVTTDQALPARIVEELERQLPELEREEIARQALASRGRILVVENLEEAIDLANRVAIEHLELMISNPWQQIPFIRHAGAIFLGAYTPEAAGDYLAGPNHVLPTMGTARFASALGVETFLKKSSIISYSRQGLAADAEHIQALARLEGLTAHAASVGKRFGNSR
ncbi:MAG: histidinol dehydrogenase [Desulfofustis sp.]|jgi:histidinol dehydrogenase|nr:histidinol dehydrogenase [Desulfofustis sp.]